MSGRPTAPAELPPEGIIGLDASWSRLVRVPGIDGVGRTWHLLDSWASRLDPTGRPAPNAAEPDITLLCVHGNPSWSFLWRDLLAQVEAEAGDRIRVVAVDQLDMGFSERTGRNRILATRVDDLCQLTEELGVSGAVVTVAHDWGGPISLGWALRHLPGSHAVSSAPRQPAHPWLAGVVLTNTAVHQPAGSPAPAIIRLIRSRPMLRQTTVNTPAFIRGAIEMSRPRPSPEIRAGFEAPYLDRTRRFAIADFVGDIPLDPGHESAVALDSIASGLDELADTPALLLWGPKDKVFSDLYLHDLERRLPHADVHRFPAAAHFVTEDADVAGAVTAWIITLDTASTSEPDAPERPSAPTGGSEHRNRGSETRGSEDVLPRALSDFSVADQEGDAIVELAPAPRSITFGELTERVEQLAAGMAAFGIAPGDRVAVMVPPGIDLSLAVYGCWRLGVTLVLVDSGLGPAGMRRSLVSADPDHLIGIDRALAAASALRWPGRRIAVGKCSASRARLLGARTDLESLIELGTDRESPVFPAADAIAAVAFTSGATGPSKGVVYRHHQIQAQRDALMGLYDITSDDRLVAAFAPFALYGPTMGITSIVPDMDVTAPGTLTAPALGDAVANIDATLVFASPAALANVVATAETTTQANSQACAAVRLVLSAGAPVRTELLHNAASIFTSADFHTPYGMTEVLPVTDISLVELDEVASGRAPMGETIGDGVCVGRPLRTVTVAIDPIDHDGEPTGALSTDPGRLGEIVVRAPHAREGYDRLWLTEHRASQPAGWHRSGDVGQLDESGRLWVGGRLGHVITTPSGPLAPVDAEQRIEMLDDVALAAVVGVGPVGTQATVVVIQVATEAHPVGGASIQLLDRIRAVVDDDIDIAAALVVRELPVDRRHNSKVDRAAVASWAARALAGERVSSL